MSELRDILLEWKTPYAYKLKEQKKITKSKYPNLGVNMEVLRDLAKLNVDEEIEYPEVTELFYEELLLLGLIIGYKEKPINEKWDLINEYLDKVDSWALVDTFASNFKLGKEEYEPTFEVLRDYLDSDNEFYQRFALIMFLYHYIKLNNNYKRKAPIKLLELKHFENPLQGNDRPFIPKILKLIDKEYKDNEASIACAKLGSEIFLIAPYTLTEFLKNDHLDTKTHDRMIDRILRFNNMSKSIKTEIKKLKKYE